MKTYTVNDTESCAAFRKAVEDNFKLFGWTRYKIQTSKDRTIDQNALAFALYNDLSNQDAQGDVNHYRSYCKLHFGVPIMLEDEDFSHKWVSMIKNRFTYEEKLALMLEPFDFPVTRLMSKKQFAAYVDMIKAEFPLVRFKYDG